MNRPSNAVLTQIHTLFSGGSIAGQTDSDLLDRFVRSRDEGAFAILVARHGPMVFAVCRRVLSEPQDAEDAFQATFLVLVRKAGTLARREQVGNWLYGVAYRTALEARTRAARRRAQERRLSVKPWTTPTEIGEAPDLGQILDDELRQLPQRYRAPLVLCALEGRTRADAAQALGLPEGTLSSRLSRARVLLRERLTRRGLELPAGAFAAALARDASAGAVPETLAQSTVYAAIRFAARTSTAGAATAPAVNLAQGVLKMMVLTKVKVVAVMLVCSLMVATGVVAQFGGTVPQAGAPNQPGEGARLNSLEQKLDRVLEVLGVRTASPNAPLPPRPVEETRAPAAGGGLPAGTTDAVLAPPKGLIRASNNSDPKSEAQRLSEVEDRVTRIEQQLTNLAGRIDRLEGRPSDNVQPNERAVR